MKTRRPPATDQQPIHPWRGGGKLAIRATTEVIDLVEQMHRTIASGPAVLGSPFERLARAWTGGTYGTLRGVTRWVGTGVDLTLAQVGPLLGKSPPGPQREALLAALNGVVGDYLSESGNPLAIPMELRSGGRGLRLEREALREQVPQPGRRLLVLVHGSSMNDLQWNRAGHDHGSALARDLGYTPLYLRYNSGLHISTNGRALSGLLEQLVSAWPDPVEELSILGHSMGGLVARSACLAAEENGQRWRQQLQKLVCLGSPHHGALLERGGSWVEFLLGVSRYSAPFVRLGQLRSAGVTDLRFGNVQDLHWEGVAGRWARLGDPRKTVSLPQGVDCYAIAATRSPPLEKRLSGDGLVTVDSALGRNRRPELTLAFPEANQWIAYQASHLDLLSSPEVFGTLRSWLSRPRQPPASAA
ncbi:MAG: GPI inositol-deacylase [Myxococcota bacterium]|nr:GPI inositol-deacylase [Myxococcota bacterium]